MTMDQNLAENLTFWSGTIWRRA